MRFWENAASWFEDRLRESFAFQVYQMLQTGPTGLSSDVTDGSAPEMYRPAVSYLPHTYKQKYLEKKNNSTPRRAVLKNVHSPIFSFLKQTNKHVLFHHIVKLLLESQMPQPLLYYKKHEVKLYPSYILYNMVQCQPPVKVQKMISLMFRCLKVFNGNFYFSGGEPRYKHLEYLLIGLRHYDGTVGQLILRVGTPCLEEHDSLLQSPWKQTSGPRGCPAGEECQQVRSRHHPF